MPRPPKSRAIQGGPRASYYKPRGIPARLLETVVVGLDEMEAMRLADLEGLYQEEAAARMGISRPTFGRLVEQARRKVADALFHGKALVLEGGAVHLGAASWFACGACGQRWQLPPQAAPPDACTDCGSKQVSGVPGPEPCAGGGGRGRGRRGRGHGCGRQ